MMNDKSLNMTNYY